MKLPNRPLKSAIEAIGNTPLVELAREEGIFAGFSSGANVAAAMDLLQESFKGKIAVVLICDSGLKYLSTDLWE